MDESRARFRLITEELDDVFAENDSDGRFTYASPNIVRLLGLTPEELVGRRIDEFVHPHDMEELAAELRFDADVVSGRRTFRLRGADGRWRWVESRGRAYRLPNGERRFVGIARDATEAREAERRFRLLGSHGGDLVVETDQAGRIRYASPNHERMLGHGAASLVGRRVWDFIHAGDAAPIEAFLGSAVAGASTKLTYRMRHARGSWCSLESIGNAYLDTHDAIRFLWLCRDVTDQIESRRALIDARRRLEAVARNLEFAREQERAEIARDVHDDLGQGLVGLRLGLGSLLAEAEPDSFTHARLKRMETELDHLGECVHLITTRLWPEALKLGLAAAIETQARELAAAAGWTLRLDLAPADLAGDPGREAAIFRIAQEAITNIARHADARSVEISMHPREGVLYLEIRDDGCGLPEHVRQRGGFGLAGMRERALAWGGHLEVRSEGPGTTVHVEIPLRPEPDAQG